MAWKHEGDRGRSYAGAAFIVLRISLGVFMIAKGLDKLAWFTDPGILDTRLHGFLGRATPANRWWVTLLIPGAAVFARLVPAGEIASGLALIAGAYTRLASILALLMILNFHLATGALFRADFFADGQAFPVIGGLLAVALAGDRAYWSLRPR